MYYSIAEDVKLIGVYSNEKNANRAISKLKKVQGFSESHGEFSIDKYELDKDHWVEGFITI